MYQPEPVFTATVKCIPDFYLGMEGPSLQSKILAAVGKALLDKGEGYSVGKLVAELEGDGVELESDPSNVWDKHFYQDVADVDDWPDDPRPPAEVDAVIDALEMYWETHESARFCQIICNANLHKNGFEVFEKGETYYTKPISALTDEQLIEYCESRTVGDGED